MISEKFNCNFDYFVFYVSGGIVTGFGVNLVLEVWVAFKLSDPLDMVWKVVCLSSGDMFGKGCNSSWDFYACQGVSIILCGGSGKA